MKHALTDIGVNLTSRQFDRDREQVLQRALAAGVERLLVTGLSARVSQAALELARRWPQHLACTAGVHPHNSREFDAHTQAELRNLARHPEVVAIGECGLDYDRDFSPRATQRRAFEAQLELAAELGRPVFLHERCAHADFVAILGPLASRLIGGVVHCFTGTDHELEAYLKLGLCIGITGYICDERRGLHLRELVRRVPADRLMIETDAPFLKPRDLADGGRRNEPAFLKHVLERVACALDKPAETVAQETSAAASRLFGLERRFGAATG